ncbi:MAG TPA: nucleoside hydrolase [Candidatus Mediterraneibacter norwichensis]|nr:nucleoside hydrolase [Candidatus Mediterraneibacter norwichensis]
MPKVIIDCDPGIDDALALLLALASPELDVAGITTVSGNVPADRGARNAKKVLRQADRQDVPIYIGEMAPLGGTYADAMDTHGSDGLGESFLPDVPGEFPEKPAVEFLEETLEKEETDILALGPLTNLARLFQKRPELIRRVSRFVSMGGSFRSHGNCSPVAEYNYWCDPEAAKICYELSAEAGKKIEMVGLDVTRQIVLTPNLISYMERLDKKTGGFVRKITGFYMDFHWEYEGIIGCVINDPLAAAYLIDPSMCSGFDSFLEVETEGICRGQTVVDSMNFWKKNPNSHVLTETDAKRFMSFFLSRILKKEDGTKWRQEELSCLEGL